MNIVSGFIVLIAMGTLWQLWQEKPAEKTCGARGCGPYHEWQTLEGRLQVYGLGGECTLIHEPTDPNRPLLWIRFSPLAQIDPLLPFPIEREYHVSGLIALHDPARAKILFSK